MSLNEILNAFASVPEGQRLGLELTIHFCGLFCCLSLFLLNRNGYNEGDEKLVTRTKVLFGCVVFYLIFALLLFTLEILV